MSKDNIIAFPSPQDASEAFMKGLMNVFSGRPDWKHLEPALLEMSAAVNFPPLMTSFSIDGIEKLSQEERAELTRKVHGLLHSYASQAMRPLVIKLAVAIVARVELEGKINEMAGLSPDEAKSWIEAFEATLKRAIDGVTSPGS